MKIEKYSIQRKEEEEDVTASPLGALLNQYINPQEEKKIKNISRTRVYRETRVKAHRRISKKITGARTQSYGVI